MDSSSAGPDSMDIDLDELEDEAELPLSDLNVEDTNIVFIIDDDDDDVEGDSALDEEEEEELDVDENERMVGKLWSVKI
ncbi:uncharacterized protein PHACADRAFT_189339 [Phanerochaete carnosa HHB-10118-sp]|uniref:Uncharacterized protein n=1 Tax=Phanerochaete carnosa (strain HHB-10118-sp) TaxID=650164 RepID=K5VBC9_PHACS|nr:uncharacterized protein PHACADRAFT_189339 [Phanerochaete carnosa HHB-10118-sp]EKM60206.1 hypothetical protein PHACADRAFT_189339 [Phanerochaete carnosa HHB-10118-sp]